MKMQNVGFINMNSTFCILCLSLNGSDILGLGLWKLPKVPLPWNRQRHRITIMQISVGEN